MGNGGRTRNRGSYGRKDQYFFVLNNSGSCGGLVYRPNRHAERTSKNFSSDDRIRFIILM